MVADGARFVQSNLDPWEIYALVESDGRSVAYGPLALDQVDTSWFKDGPRHSPLGAGDPALAAWLTDHSGEYHDLEDFYRFYEYPSEVVDWVEATVVNSETHHSAEGRDIAEVVDRLHVDYATLWRATSAEIVDPIGRDPAGDPLYYPLFWRNWAVSCMSGQTSINPRSHRFKAWLSVHSGRRGGGRSTAGDVSLVEDGFGCRLLQSNRDRRKIYAVAERDRASAAYGPLALSQIGRGLFGDASRRCQFGAGDPALGASLAERADEFHELDDFYRFYGYPPDTLAWVDATAVTRLNRHGWIDMSVARGRAAEDVADRLGIDRAALDTAADSEIAAPDARDKFGYRLLYPEFWDNWAIGFSTWRWINPRSYRFKAWLSFHT